MEIGIALEIDAELDRLSGAVTRLDDRLRTCFSEREYGEGVSSVFIGLILMGAGSQKLHPVRPFQYRKSYKFTDVMGQRQQLKDVVTLDVKPDYDSLCRLNAEAAERYIADALIEAIAALLGHENKFPMFDAVQFSEDFAICLRR